MKAIVEFGIPQSAIPGHPCGVDSGSGVIFPSAVQAAKAAVKLAHVLSKGRSDVRMQGLYPTPSAPRVTWWAADKSAWVCVSLLDGVSRGDYGQSAGRAA